MDPATAERLLELAREGKVETSDEAFLGAARGKDSFAEELAEAAVGSMTSGEDQFATDLEAPVDEEIGGPFVETSGSQEFADGTDESNIDEATREPFPTT